jgi:beta-mannosidase
VHQDLVRAGAIADPFRRLGEVGARWVDDADWTYRTTFVVSPEQWAGRGSHGRHFLQFGGLDTLARVYLNDVLIAETENAYIPFRFDVTESLREGENSLRVEFDSAMRVGTARANAYLGDGTSERGSQTYFNFGPRAFLRKPQYQWGWDWGPELVGAGISGAVELVTVPHAEITDWHLRYEFTDPVTVNMTILLTVTKYSPEPLTAGVALYAPGDNTPQAQLPDAPGTYTLTLPIRGQKVAPWNPNGQDILRTLSLPVKPKGDAQKRYLLNLRVWRTDPDPDADKEFVFHKGITVGFKKVELLHEPDADGAGIGMKFRVNGFDTFIKGANWIPDSPFPAAITREQLRHKLTLARDAGFNMLRIWGGGLYESEEFYNLCDELGLLVWQDFGFACSMYPDDLPEFVEAVRVEATAAVKRIRHRACLALWCGGNENQELHQNRWSADSQATQFFGDKLIHETLPSVLAELDPDTPYWPNSPYSGLEGVPATSDDYGDAHYWKVWHGLGDWIHYTANDCRFSSEFGFASPCGFAAWESCTNPADRTPRSAVAQWHDKTRKGYDTYLGYIELHFPKIETWDDLVYYGQANQAMALSYGVEHWRRRKGRCWGTLFWQHNDCWPTQSWAVVDSSGEGKLAYYAAKRTFYKPVLVSLAHKDGKIEAHVINDTLLPVRGTLSVSFRRFTDGGNEAGDTVSADIAVEANAVNVGAALTVPVSATILANRHDLFVHARLTSAEGTVIGDNILFLGEPKELNLSDPNLSLTTQPGDNGSTVVTLSARSFVGFVHLRVDGLISANGIVPSSPTTDSTCTRRDEIRGIDGRPHRYFCGGTAGTAFCPSFGVAVVAVMHHPDDSSMKESPEHAAN